nr:hypothetical protein [uncultured Flavobacterium sp.]
MKISYSFLLFFLFSLSFSQTDIAIIPQPQDVFLKKSSFYITPKTCIQADENSFEATYLKEAIKTQTELNLNINFIICYRINLS